MAYALGMPIQMNIAEAKATLSELVARAEAGEQVVIARDGKPVVALAPVQAFVSATRRLGLWDEAGAGIPEDLFLGLARPGTPNKSGPDVRPGNRRK